MVDAITRVRAEVKGAVPRGEAPRVVDFLACYLELVRESRVATLYFDHPDRRLSRAARASPRRNLKLRARTYFTPEGALQAPFVWLEVKRRAGAVCEKTRLRLHRVLFDRFLRGDDVWPLVPACQEMPLTAEETRPVFEEILRSFEGAEAPVGAVTFRRLTFETEFPLARVTVDRDVRYHAAPRAVEDLFDLGALDAPLGREPGTLVEVKHGAVRPLWYTGLLRGLTLTEHSKFLALLDHVD
jgi:hypothetical protein